LLKRLNYEGYYHNFWKVKYCLLCLFL
jgi:hypothetical protein